MAKVKSLHESSSNYNSTNADLGHRETQVVSAEDVIDTFQSSIPARMSQFQNVIQIVPPLTQLELTHSPVPLHLKKVLSLGLEADDTTTPEELKLMDYVKNEMKLNYLDESNYKKFFRHVLWMEEVSQEANLNRHIPEKITMTQMEGSIYTFSTNGLSEKKLKTLPNIVINIITDKIRDTVFQGIVQKVRHGRIYIESLQWTFHLLFDEESTIEAHISFQPDRITLERMHLGIHYISKNIHLMNSLFPGESPNTSRTCKSFKINSEYDVFNKDIFHNPEQKQAVENIVNCTSGDYPYIVYGPPGTGKTSTIVEAILQIKKKDIDYIILVCTPSNAACNDLSAKLIPWCGKNELLRIQSYKASLQTVDQTVREHSNCANDEYNPVDGEDLQNYNIIVTTLATSGRYLKMENFHPRYVFIDEASQASEPEAAMAIGLLADKFQLVLAGDPKQLGPLVISEAAAKYHLDVSLLERLMERTVYKESNAKFITMLKINFRSHPDILYLSNKLFYGIQLKAMSLEAKLDPIADICVFAKMYPTLQDAFHFDKRSMATEFYALFSEEKRRDTSYFNPEEADMVIQTVEALCKLTETKVNQKDIGVITPYNSQVDLIRKNLMENGFGDVEVGSTESFQGREKRIIIISTVRAKKVLPLDDAKNHLGFISNPQRFNVAVTRAKSKLILIGSPIVLQLDDQCWLQYINFCRSGNSYFEEPFRS